MNLTRVLGSAGGGVLTVGLAAFSTACAPLTVQAEVAGRTLTVTGTADSDTIALRLKAGASNTVQVDAGDESMSLDADGPRAVLVRNVGNVRMVVDGVETLDLAMLDGFDNFSVGANMGNTVMSRANVDMSVPGGGSDAMTDSVNLAGTADADHITVGATGTRIDVAGTPVATSITGSKIPDQLQIAAEGPDDTIVVDPAVDALISMLINPHV